jgi:hypothetical protein
MKGEFMNDNQNPEVVVGEYVEQPVAAAPVEQPVTQEYVEQPAAPAPGFVPPSAGYVPPPAAPAPSFDDAATFIGPNADYYIPQFQKLDSTNSMISWNWAAFLCSIWWMLYRKMYLYALIAFAIACIPGIGSMAIWIGSGVLGNWLYKKKVEEELAAASAYDPATRKSQLAARGGITWVPVIVLSVLVALGILSFCSIWGLAMCSAALSPSYY